MITILAFTPTGTTVLIFILVVLFVLSFLFAGAEMAFFSLTAKDINMLKTRQQPSYKRIVSLLESPKILQSSLLISNCFVNIGIILILNSLINEWISTLSLHAALNFIIKVVVLTFVLVMFGEVLPKVWATHHKIWFAATASMIVSIFNSIFYSLSQQLVTMNESIAQAFHQSSSDAEENQLNKDIDLLPSNAVTVEEKKILKGIKKFSNTTVKQIMRTRLDVTGIESSSSFRDVVRKVNGLHYSRLPVYKQNLDEITGILHTKDLLPHINEEEMDWHTIVKPVLYVHEQKLIEDLLQDFRTRRIHIAVVVDEFGGTSGIVTIEDIMAEIVGDIHDEFDVEKSSYDKIDESNYIFEGKTMIKDVCRILNLPTHTFDILKGESDSVAGLILEIAREFPAENQPFETRNFIFTPLEIKKNRIEKVKITLRSKDKIKN